ncbi:MAG: hypothetical protein Kow0092_13710 [Deferrisomatales bacterium]
MVTPFRVGAMQFAPGGRGTGPPSRVAVRPLRQPAWPLRAGGAVEPRPAGKVGWLARKDPRQPTIE